jgi:hypothetical protein
MNKKCLVKTLAMCIVVLFIGMSTTFLVESHSIKINSEISLITIQVVGNMVLKDWYASDVAFNFTIESYDIATVYYNIDDSEWTEYIDPFVVHGNGEHSLQWYAVDYEGNISNIDGPFNFNIDQSPPNISLKYEILGGSPEQGWEILMTATATDDYSGMDRVEFYLEDILHETVTGSGPIYQSYFTLHIGDHIKFLKVVGYDKVGNSAYFEIYSGNSISEITDVYTSRSFPVQSESEISSIKIVKRENYGVTEKLFPESSIVGNIDPTYIIVVISSIMGNNNWCVSNVTLSFVPDPDGIAEVYYNLNDGDWNLYSEPVVISDDGVYVFSWYAIDSEGNISTPESTTFKIDKIPPEITLNKERLDKSHIKFIANVIDGVSGVWKVKFYLDNLFEYNDTDFPFEWTWNITDNHKHTVKAIVYDMAGNSASSSIIIPRFQSHDYGQLSFRNLINQQIIQLFKNILLRYQMRYM